MPNPRVNPGVLNRVRGTLKCVDYPELNISASFVTKPNIRITRNSDPNTRIPVMTGEVQSPQPYMSTTAEIHLNRAAGLADVYMSQVKTNTNIGDVEIWTDTPALGNITLYNCSLNSVGVLDLSGEDPELIFEIAGTELTNDDMWSV